MQWKDLQQDDLDLMFKMGCDYKLTLLNEFDGGMMTVPGTHVEERCGIYLHRRSYLYKASDYTPMQAVVRFIDKFNRDIAWSGYHPGEALLVYHLSSVPHLSYLDGGTEPVGIRAFCNWVPRRLQDVL